MTAVGTRQPATDEHAERGLLAQVSGVSQDALIVRDLSAPDNAPQRDVLTPVDLRPDPATRVTLAPKALRVPLDELRIKANVTAGLNPFTLMTLWALLRNTTEDPEPVLVRHHPDGGWLLLDGRHRMVAALAAGRADVLAMEES